MADLKDRMNKAADTAKNEGQGLVDRAKEAAHNVAERASDVAGTARDKAQEWAGDARDAAQHAGERVQRWAGDAYDVTAEQVGDFGKELTSLVRKHPIPALLIGFGVGLLLGRTARMI
jgi:ElaB/YqjD/DUF883 family membrane-anchored ribosome-binding protein